MIEERELELLRVQQEAFMPELVTVKRRLHLGDGDSTYHPLYTDVHARLHPGMGVWRTVADRFQGITPFTLTVPWDQDLKAGDMVLQGTGDDTRVFDVRDVKTPSSYHTAIQALCDLTSD